MLRLEAHPMVCTLLSHPRLLLIVVVITGQLYVVKTTSSAVCTLVYSGVRLIHRAGKLRLRIKARAIAAVGSLHGELNAE
jgi:hypothetical protein